MTNEVKNEVKKKKLRFFGLGKIVPYLKKYRLTVFAMICCGLVGSAIDILLPQFHRYALNHFVVGNTLDTLAYFIVLYVVTVLTSALVNYICFSFAIRVEVSINRDLRNDAFEHLQTLSFSYFNQNSVGYIHARIMSDTERVGNVASWCLMDGVWHISYLIGSIIAMMAINFKLALMICSIVPLIAVLFSLFEGKLVKVNREVREINSRITGNFNEGITGAKTIKSLVIEEKMERDFTDETLNMRKTAVKSARIRGLFSMTMNFASSLALAILLWRGGYIAAEEVGTFSVFMSYAQGMMEPVRWIIDIISELVTAQVNIERLTNLIETEPNVKDSDEVIAKYGDAFEPKRENWEEIRGDIEFRDVSFKYPDGDEYVLEHFNLDIPFGTNVAVVGETGAGKSTIANLICRFFEPTDGAVMIDGSDSRERSQLWLHSAIGYVLQTPHLFSGTVRENLLYGNPDATDEDIDRAIKLVSAEGVIEKLEDGIDSDVDEGGDRLSTGEKQLISFARAIIANPKILILDEATASVDTITEQKIQSAIEEVIKGRTSVVIAHRLSTVRNADVILVVKDGKIIERGRHEDLMAERGHYYRLYTRQYEDEATTSVLKK
ncbi:MAG: ABC transporter ATP-binding protein [Clostridia bacterium]|nr:ABC transporter ATP-binding protein [Clostridia bacterium]